MKEFYDFLKDEDELKWFFNHCVFKPKLNEVFCFSLTVRNKTLSEEERKRYQIGKTEMLMPNIISFRDDEEFTFDKWKRGVLKYEVNKEAMTSRSGLPYPEKATVIYYYIHASDEVKVLAEGEKHIAELNQELINAALAGSKKGIDETLSKLKRASNSIKRMHACFPGTKHFLDFDMDIEHGYDKYSNILNILKSKLNVYFGKGNYFIIDTSGGFHILVKKESVNGNPKEFINDVVDEIKVYGNEIVKEFTINKNSLIPLPGTAQYGRLVKIINKEDFDG